MANDENDCLVIFPEIRIHVQDWFISRDSCFCGLNFMIRDRGSDRDYQVCFWLDVLTTKLLSVGHVVSINGLKLS